MESLIYRASNHFYVYAPMCCVTVLVRKSAPIAVAESHLKPQFSPKNGPCRTAAAEFIKPTNDGSSNEKKLRSHRETLRWGRKEGTSGGPRQEDNEDEDKLFPRGRGTGGNGTFFGGGN